METPHQRGWHSRGYLPHLDFRTAVQAVTFRLADALPKRVLERWKREIGPNAPDEILRRIAAYEDAGHGSCLLHHSANAEIVVKALGFFQGDRYELLEWVVMPNHVHVLCKPHSEPLDRVVQSWKRVSARHINERLGRSGRLWARDYFDRAVRDEVHLFRCRRYIRMNPVKAGLCREPEDWPYGSATERQF